MNEGMRFWVKSVLVVLISFTLCFSQTHLMPQRPVQTRKSAPFLQQAKFYEETPYVTKVVLKNGLTVLVNEYRAQPVVSIQAYIHTGFSDEPPQNPGIARLLAAMLYRRASDKSAGTLRQNVQALGGQLRRSMDFDNMQFEIVAPSSQWKKTLDLQADALLNLSLNREELELATSLVLDEARSALDDPFNFADEKLLELGFRQPRMGQNDAIVLGSLRNISQESLTDFYKAAFMPEKMMLVISGDISSSDVLNEIIKVYDKFSGPGVKQASLPFETSQSGLRYSGMRGSVPIPLLLLGFHTVSENSEDYRALEVLNAILGSGEGSVLASRLKDQKKLIFAQETNLTTYSNFGYLSIRLEVDPQNIDRSEIAALTEIELLKREDPSEADMERALAQLERSYWKRLETVTERARILAHYESLGDWKRMDRRLSELRKIKPSDVKRVANKYLRLQNCSLLEYLPESGEARDLTVESVRQTFEGLLTPSTNQEEEARAREVVPAVKIPPGSGSFAFSEIRYPFQVASILRGPDMFIREDHTAPLIDLGLFFPGGKLAESKDNAGITELMVRLMLEGAQSGNISQFYRQLEIYGGQVKPVVTDDYFGFYFSILSRNFEAGFNLLQDAIKSPNFDRDEIGRQKDLQIAEMVWRKSSGDYARQLMNQILFKDFSYSLDRDGTEASLGAITRDSLQNWYDTYVKNRKPVVAAIGDTKGTSLASYFVRYFSGSRMQDIKIPQESVKPLGKGESIEQKWSKGQSVILVGFQAPPVDDEDGLAAAVIESLAGGLGLFPQELEDRLGLSYKVSLEYEPRLRGGSMIACAASRPGIEDATLKALQEAIRRIIADPITYRDFRAAVNSAVGAYGIRSQIRSSQIADMVERVLAGTGIEGFRSFMSSLQDVKEEDLKDVAQRIFELDKAVILRIHGQSER